ncbi:MAG: HYR domain-containing protein, partial [Psychroserpens sp.]|uniref:HYR domain-containing protein n=1 Tax=Psychroserpens sp. TaxID=2020870 RepID=UPI003002F6F9
MKRFYFQITLIIALFFSFNISAQTTYTFTNAGATGRFGPTQGQVDTAYGPNVVTIGTQGIQEWTVPVTGTYSIQAIGGQGGKTNTTFDQYRGEGAYMKGDFYLTAGQVLKVVVGQQGIENPNGNLANGGGHGGGGSFVWINLQTTPLIVAGGGGGGSIINIFPSGSPNSLLFCEGKIAPITNDGLSSHSGVANFGIAGGDGTQGAQPAKGWTSMRTANDFTGDNHGNYQGQGGFGGGGGPNDFSAHAGGGGGGYSGGGNGQMWVNSGTGNSDGRNGGGGGGSFNSGANQANAGGVNTGHGSVIITSLIPCDLQSVTATVTDATCAGNDDGEAMITITFSGVPVAIEGSLDGTNWFPFGTPPNPFSFPIDNLVAGPYSVSIREANNISCESSVQFTIGTLASPPDNDGDGFSVCDGDCDDNDPSVNPGATEVCDSIDNNCDGNTDESGGPLWYADLDSDGFGDENDPGTSSCFQLPDTSDNNQDCNDSDSNIHPLAQEICDGIDNNCDGTTDEGFDLDNDGVTVCAGDCDDTNASVFPGAPEINCDGVDNDCNPSTPDNSNPVNVNFAVTDITHGPVTPLEFGVDFIAGTDYTFGSAGTNAGEVGGRTWIFTDLIPSAYGGLWFTFNNIENPIHSSQAPTGSMIFHSFDSNTGVATFYSTAPMTWINPATNSPQSVNTQFRMQVQPALATGTSPMSSGVVGTIPNNFVDGGEAGLPGLGLDWPTLDISQQGDFQVWFAFEVQGTNQSLTQFYDNASTPPNTSFFTSVYSGFYKADDICSNPGNELTMTATADANNTGPFTYIFNNIMNTTGVFPGIAAGTYNYSVLAANGCLTNGTQTVDLVDSLVDYANLQFPGSEEICEGDTMTAYGQVYEGGLTDASNSPVTDIEVEFAYFTSNTDPSTWPGANWTSAIPNPGYDFNQNNDEYLATFGASLSPGTYYYTFRYSLTGCDWQYGGYPNGFWNGTTQNSGVLTVLENHSLSLTSANGNQTVCPNTAIEDIVYTFGGGAVSATISPVLPAGLAFNPVTATISGTPAQSGIYNFTISTFGTECPSAELSGTITVKELLDYGNLQYPGDATICEGQEITAYGRIFEAGLTPNNGNPGSIVDAEFGYGANPNPLTWTNWSDAPYNVQAGNDDEYSATFGASLTTGTYYYTFRYALDGCEWQYAGYTPNGGGFLGGANVVGELTVNEAAVITSTYSNINTTTDFGQCGATVNYAVAVVTGDPNPSVTYSHPSGTFFDIGTTTVIITATNSCATVTKSFVVTVADDEAPTITCPANINAIATSAAGAVVTYTEPQGADNCGITSTDLISSLGTGDTFPIGNTVVTYETTDTSGSVTPCSFTVTVTGIAPVIACPGDITQNTDPGLCSAVVDFEATDTIGIPASTITYSQDPNTVFPVGITIVTATATNAVGSTSCMFNVIVEDNEDPTFTCVDDQTKDTDPNTCAYEVQGGEFDPTNIVDNCPGATIENDYNNSTTLDGAVFDLGTTTVTWTVTDNGGSQPRVAVLSGSDSNPPWEDEVITKLTDTGIFKSVDGIDIEVQTPSLATLLEYDAVLVWTDEPIFDPVALGNVLAAYVDAGGGVVVNMFTQFSPSVFDLEGDFRNNGYLPLDANPANFAAAGPHTMNIINGSHPIMQGVTNFNGGSSSFRGINLLLQPGASLLANWSTGDPLIAYKEPTNGKTVSLNFFAPSSDSRPDLWDANTDGDLIMANSLAWAAGIHNTATCSFDVIVTDKEAPTITCPGAVSVTADGGFCEATGVALGSVSTSDNCPGETVSNDAPASYPVGITTVTWTVEDAAGNTASCTQTVTVTDDELPVIDCNADITVPNDAGVCGAEVTYSVTGDDNCTGSAEPSAPLVISGVFDATLSGGLPKGVELYALEAIADLSIYGIGGANNGGGTDGQEFTFPAVAVAAGQFIYVASESSQFTSFFGFAPDYTTGAMLINGDDAIELFKDGSVIDVFGDINVDGTGQPWEYLDGWAYRNSNTGPDGSTFQLSSWSFSGPNALDGETTNAGAAAPFPAGAYEVSVFPKIEQTAGLASGSVFPIGTTTNTFVITDASNNTATCSFNVTVNDTELPTISCNADITVPNDAGVCGAEVTYSVTGDDNCTGSAEPSAPLVISGVFDATLSGGLPKGVELYALEAIADLSIYGIGGANNGGGTDGQEFTFPAVAVAAGQFIYVASESSQFTSFFGFAPDYTTGAMLINGDDAIELFKDGSVIDVFGDINVDGTGQPWEYLDGWAYRNSNTGPDGSTFQLSSWSFSGPNALDGETTNAGAAAPFPAGAYEVSVFPKIEQTAGLASGSVFPIGTTTNTFVITDASNNTATCSFNVTVNDTELPTISCNADITVPNDAGVCGAEVTYSVTGDD